MALTTIPTNAEVLLNRATAYLKLRKFYEALQVSLYKIMIINVEHCLQLICILYV